MSDLFTGGLSWRRLGVLVRGLPRTSNLARALHPDGAAAWTLDSYLLAAAVDALHSANWQRTGKRSTPKPKPIPRPGDEPKGAKHYGKPLTIAEFEARMAQPVTGEMTVETI